MHRLILIGALTVLTGGEIAAQAPATGAASVPEIANSGVGEVKLRPDRATLSVAVVTRAPTAAAAGRLNAERMRPLLAALRRQSLPDSAITTSGYSVQIDYTREPSATRPEIRGYVATNSVRVRLTRLDDLGQVIDTALAAGATGISNVTFESSLARAARQRAIGMAVRDARADATAAAEAAGGTLGPIIEISFESGPAINFSARAIGVSEAMAVQTPIMPDDITVMVQVRVRSVLLRAAP
jgi:hypothetical protein